VTSRARRFVVTKTAIPFSYHPLTLSKALGLKTMTVDSGEVRKLVDRNDFQLKQLEPLHARGNDLICLLDAGCV
jgi:hypothetical protein